MESRVIQLTPAAHKHGNLNIRPCDLEFFPKEAIGSHSRKKGVGKLLTLHVAGLPNPVKTDIPTDKKTGKPRTIFRERKWVKDFVQIHNLHSGDRVTIQRINKSKYSIFPSNKKKNETFVGLDEQNDSKSFICSSKYGTTKLSFVDLFSGVGGFRIALKKLGGTCLGFSEIDKDAIEIYKANFVGFSNNNEKELGDVTKLGKFPFQVDLIVGGVPCQSWSVAGRKRGFDDPRGKLWMDTIRIVDLNKPKAFIFENVKGLIDPRNSKSLEFLVNEFEKLNYNVKYDLLNSYDFGLPQNRERIFIVGTRKDSKTDLPFSFPKPLGTRPKLYEFIDEVAIPKNMQKKKFSPKELFGNKIPMARNRFQKANKLNDFFIFCDTRNGHTTIHSWDIIKTSKREKEICMLILRNRRKKIYGPSDGNPLSYEILKTIIPNLKKEELEKLVDKKILRTLESKGYEFVNSKNSSGINGVYRIFLPHSDIFSTLTATGTKDMVALESIKEASPEVYKQEFISSIVHKNKFRPISAREAARLQGFPDNFTLPKNERKAHKQFGNAVSTNVVFYLAKSLIATGIFR